ncbi:MAG: hypothetical protein K8S25_00475 [Alphaproteobacteria bacterium]|nr:hypothetical protein [Alphaproteobacteria bacterium]
MRYATLGLALALAATGLALAQPIPAPTTAGAPAAERKLMPINWAEVREAVRSQRLVRAKLPKLSFAADALQPSLPMLLPVEQRIVAAAVSVFPQQDSYSASMRMGDVTVEVHGERRAAVLNANDPMLRLMTSKNTARLTAANVAFALDKTEGGFDLTFGRFGAAYLVSIECRNPEEERCVKPDFIRALAESMGLFGKDAP